MATNALGPFLLTKLLEPLLLQTAKQSPDGTTRIVWVASMMALGTPAGGIVWDGTAGQPSLLTDSFANYMQSKAGVVFLAHEYAKTLREGGVISLVSQVSRGGHSAELTKEISHCTQVCSRRNCRGICLHRSVGLW